MALCLYASEPLFNIDNDCIIININKTYNKNNPTPDNIYNATKETWTINKNKLNSIKYVLSEYNGIIIEVFMVLNWYQKIRQYNTKKYGKTKLAYGFNGTIDYDDIRNKYLFKSIKHCNKKGNINVIRYSI